MRQARRGRLVHVQHVEVAVAQPPPHPAARTPGRTRAGRPSRCRAPGPRGRPSTTYGGSALVVVGRARAPTPRGRARCSSSARSRTCACTPPGTSQEYGQTMPTLIGPRRPSPGARRRGRRPTAAAACASPPGARRSRARTRRRRLGRRGDPVAALARRPATVDRRVDAVPAVAPSVEPERHRQQRGAGARRASSGRPGRHPRRLAEESTATPRRGQVAVGEQADQRRPRAAARSSVERRRVAAGQRQHLHAERRRKATNRSNSASGLSRSATVVNGAVRRRAQAPARSQLPMCGRARTDAAAGGQRLGEHARRRRCRTRVDDPLAASIAGQPERLAASSAVGAHALRATSASQLGVGGAGTTRRRLASQLLDAACRRRAPRRVGDHASNSRRGDRSGIRRIAAQPAAIAERRRPAASTRAHVPPPGCSRRADLPTHVHDPLADGDRGWRRRAPTARPARTYGHAEAGSSAAATSAMISRSARSAMPTSQCMPRPSARALA